MFDVVPWRDNEELTASWLFDHDRQLYEFSRIYHQANHHSSAYLGWHPMSSECEFILDTNELVSDSIRISIKRHHFVGLSSDGYLLFGKKGYAKTLNKNTLNHNLLVLVNTTTSIPSTLYYETAFKLCDYTTAQDLVEKGQGLVIARIDWTKQQLDPLFIPMATALGANFSLWQQVIVIQQYISDLWNKGHQDVLLDVWIPQWGMSVLANTPPTDWLLKQAKGLIRFCNMYKAQLIEGVDIIDTVSTLSLVSTDLTDAISIISTSWKTLSNDLNKDRLSKNTSSSTKKMVISYENHNYEIYQYPIKINIFDPDSHYQALDVGDAIFRKGLLMLVSKKKHNDLGEYNNRISYQLSADIQRGHIDTFILYPIIDSVFIENEDYFVFQLLDIDNNEQEVILMMGKNIATTDLHFYIGKK